MYFFHWATKMKTPMLFIYCHYDVVIFDNSHGWISKIWTLIILVNNIPFRIWSTPLCSWFILLTTTCTSKLIAQWILVFCDKPKLAKFKFYTVQIDHVSKFINARHKWWLITKMVGNVMKLHQSYINHTLKNLNQNQNMKTLNIYLENIFMIIFLSCKSYLKLHKTQKYLFDHYLHFLKLHIINNYINSLFIWSWRLPLRP